MNAGSEEARYKQKLVEFYDRLCASLTNLENPDESGYTDVDFYRDVVLITNDMSILLN